MLQNSTLTLGEINNVLTVGSMKDYTSSLSGGKIDSLATYVEDLQVPPTTTTTTTLPLDTAGQYAAKCASCHGANGEGVGGFPALQTSTLTLGEITASLTTGSMASFTTGMTGPQIDAMAQFTKDMQGPPGTTTTTTIPPTSAGIYAARCAGCHGASGEGGIALSLQASTMSLADGKAILKTGSMATFTGGMTNAQKNDLAVFVKNMQVPQGSTTTTTLPAANGAAIYAAKCASCHGANAGGVPGFGPSLRTSTLSTSGIRASLTTGSMGGFATGLTSQQLDALISYTRNVQDPAATTTTTTLASGLSGKALYISQCAMCHGNGVGSMGGYSSTLTSDQIELVSIYTVSLQVTSATTTTVPIGAGGDSIYGSQCAGCHGPNGEGGVGGSLLAGNLSLSEITELITNGVGSMPGYAGTLTPEQIDAVSAHSLALQDATVTTTVQPTGGAELYVSYCSACHGPSGNGGIGSTIVGLDLTLDEFVDITRNGAGAMHGFVQILSDEQIETLGAYLLNLGQVGSVRTSLAGIADPAEMYTVACAVCHGVGAKGAIGSDLTGTDMSLQDMIAVIADGAPSMPAYGEMMDARQIGALAEFIAGLEGGGGPAAETSIVVASPLPVPGGEDGGSSLGLTLLVLALLAAGGLGGLAFWRYKTQQSYR